MELEKINKIWPRIGGVCAVIITIIVLARWNASTTTDRLILLFWQNLAILMFHEFEEYVIPGGFKEFANAKTVLSLPEPEENAPISETLIITINLGIWVIFIAAALLGNVIPWLGVGMIFFNVINILGHLVIFQKKVRGYNPGVITSALMIPFLVYAIIFVIQNDILDTAGMTAAIVIGVISGASLPITGAILRKKHINKRINR